MGENRSDEPLITDEQGFRLVLRYESEQRSDETQEGQQGFHGHVGPRVGDDQFEVVLVAAWRPAASGSRMPVTERSMRRTFAAADLTSSAVTSPKPASLTIVLSRFEPSPLAPLVSEIVHTSRPANLECDCEPNTDGECAHWLEEAIKRGIKATQEGQPALLEFITEKATDVSDIVNYHAAPVTIISGEADKTVSTNIHSRPFAATT